jgi:hypothetical protein
VGNESIHRLLGREVPVAYRIRSSLWIITPPTGPGTIWFSSKEESPIPADTFGIMRAGRQLPDYSLIPPGSNDIPADVIFVNVEEVLK